MSWILGCIGNIDDEKKKRLSNLSASYLHKHQTDNLLLFAGGNINTCFYSVDNKWLVVGFIIDQIDGRKILLRDEQLNNIIASGNYESLQGHYIIVRLKDSRIQFTSDVLGLRTIYFLRDGNSIFFSTKLKWLTAISGKAELDLSEFGARWLTYNQWSHNSFIKNILKLPPGSTALIENHKIEINKLNWLPRIIEQSSELFINKIKSLLLTGFPQNHRITLGLSGGLDSRFLLSILLNEKIDFDIHTLGEKTDPDVMTARKISTDLNIDIKWLQPQTIPLHELIEKIKLYASESELVEPITSYQKLQLFEDDYFQNRILVDGAMAEFARRQFLKKLRTFGFKSIIKKDNTKVYDYIKVSRPMIFKQNFVDDMLLGISAQFENVFKEIVLTHEQIKNYPDAMIAKYRLPNYFGPEQSRLDSILMSYMPFAQMESISACLSLPYNLRNNNKLFYRTVENSFPALAKIPLIKGNTTYPFGSSTFRTFVTSRIKQKMNSHNQSNAKLFKDLEVFIKDQFNSVHVRNFELYDFVFIDRLIAEYYEGKMNREDELNWLISFELFRQGLNIR